MKENLYTPGLNAAQNMGEVKSTISAPNRRTAASSMTSILRLQTYSWRRYENHDSETLKYS
ncbi:hypothetical protein OUZ56_032893 [Daphnia magna]|uniref:Uncharacterized protein n=1 Tax=Daphnia magna TaxID=35525 RepID=A0ABR0B9V7_9CRUS|nr:hypothetical protein OUZ56_032893 [Daphnia magna]